MSNHEIHICRDYAGAVFQRVSKPLEPPDFSSDWTDHPSMHKIYENVERLALPFDQQDTLISMAELAQALTRTQPIRGEALSSRELALLLHFAQGTLSRRTRINPLTGLSSPGLYSYACGTASSGGLSPTEIYWACGSGNTVEPGLYHYDHAHHALERLLTGDVTGTIHAALGAYAPALHTNQFLLITLNFWKNAFKYNNFSYHAVTHDLGALLCSLWFLATGLHLPWQPILWYRDEVLNKLLGLQPDEESVCAVVPLPSLPEATTSVETAGLLHAKDWRPEVRKAFFQRSQRVRVFAMNSQAHQGTLITDETRPGAWKQAPLPHASLSQGEAIALPDPLIERLQGDLLEGFRKRHSSFGTFSSTHPLSRGELATLLYAGSLAHHHLSDTRSTRDTPPYTHLMVIINNVEGIARGIYAYDKQQHCLWTIRQGDMTLLLQQSYLLTNYSFAEVAAVIAIVGNLEGMLETYGNRGYRLLNAESGLIAQSIYLFSASISTACGAALGINNAALNTLLGLDQTDHKTLLLMLIGHDQPDSADLDYRLAETCNL